MIKAFAGSVCICFLFASCGGGGKGIELFTPKIDIRNPNDPAVKNIDESAAMGAAAMGAAAMGGSQGGFQANLTTEDIADIHENVEMAPEDPNIPFTPGVVGSREGEKITWTRNYRRAIEKSRVQGKPLILWFTDSQRSPISNRLSQEVFSRGDMEGWVRDNFSPLLIDKSSETDDDNKEMKLRKKKYYESMLKRFNVKGTPEVLVLNASGDVFARYRGYTKGDADFYIGRLKVAQQGASKSFGIWREKLEKKGYRMWHSIEGDNKVFAKLLSRKGDEIQLVTPEGKKYSQSMLGFARLDRDWVDKHAPKSE